MGARGRRPHRLPVPDRAAAGRRGAQRRHRPHRRVRQPRGDRRGQGRDRRGAAHRRHRGPQRRRPPRRRDGGPHRRPRAHLRRGRRRDLARVRARRARPAPPSSSGTPASGTRSASGSRRPTRSRTPPPPRRWRWPSGVPLDRGGRRRSPRPRPPRRWRMELHERGDGLVVVNDAYNANPASMTAALDALVAIGGRRRAVVPSRCWARCWSSGSGALRGPPRRRPRRSRRGLDVRGRRGRAGAGGIADGAGRSPGWAGEAVVTAGRDEAVAWVRENVSAGDVVLVKASRGAALEWSPSPAEQPTCTTPEPETTEVKPEVQQP